MPSNLSDERLTGFLKTIFPSAGGCSSEENECLHYLMTLCSKHAEANITEG